MFDKLDYKLKEGINVSQNKKEIISKLRVLMGENGLDACIIPSSDYHQSEYVGEFFKARAYVSGFTGDAGTVVITKDEAGLWTDGRFFASRVSA